MINNVIQDKECKFSYSDLDDTLIISCREENENVKDNFVLDNFIFSLTGRGKIVGVEILNASEVFKNYNANPSILNDIKKINLIIVRKDNCVAVGIHVLSSNSKATIPVPLYVENLAK